MGVSGVGRRGRRRARRRLGWPFLDARRLPSGGERREMRGSGSADGRRSASLARDDRRRARSSRRPRVTTSCSPARRSAAGIAMALRRRSSWGGRALVYLRAGDDEIDRRLRVRTGHFMPESLLRSQLDTLEPPDRRRRSRRRRRAAARSSTRSCGVSAPVPALSGSRRASVLGPAILTHACPPGRGVTRRMPQRIEVVSRAGPPPSSAPIERRPLVLEDVAAPGGRRHGRARPRAACGICRPICTSSRRAPERRMPVVPGHQIVGTIGASARA